MTKVEIWEEAQNKTVFLCDSRSFERSQHPGAVQEQRETWRDERIPGVHPWEKFRAAN